MASALPDPQITWYKNGEEILLDNDNSGKYLMSNDGRELTITNKIVDDSARYTCIARNLAGKAEKSFDVDIHGRLNAIFRYKPAV